MMQHPHKRFCKNKFKLIKSTAELIAEVVSGASLDSALLEC